jgi:hypothetical protein
VPAATAQAVSVEAAFVKADLPGIAGGYTDFRASYYELYDPSSIKVGWLPLLQVPGRLWETSFVPAL